MHRQWMGTISSWLCSNGAVKWSSQTRMVVWPRLGVTHTCVSPHLNFDQSFMHSRPAVFIVAISMTCSTRQGRCQCVVVVRVQHGYRVYITTLAPSRNVPSTHTHWCPGCSSHGSIPFAIILPLCRSTPHALLRSCHLLSKQLPNPLHHAIFLRIIRMVFAWDLQYRWKCFSESVDFASYPFCDLSEPSCQHTVRMIHCQARVLIISLSLALSLACSICRRIAMQPLLRSEHLHADL